MTSRTQFYGIHTGHVLAVMDARTRSVMEEARLVHAIASILGQPEMVDMALTVASAAQISVWAAAEMAGPLPVYLTDDESPLVFDAL